MNQYLVTFNYDHLDLQGFAIVDLEDYNQLHIDIKNREYPYTRYYGNHYMCWDSEKELMTSLTFKSLTDTEADNLYNLFDLGHCKDWGFDPRCLMDEY